MTEPRKKFQPRVAPIQTKIRNKCLELGQFVYYERNKDQMADWDVLVFHNQAHPLIVRIEYLGRKKLRLSVNGLRDLSKEVSYAKDSEAIEEIKKMNLFLRSDHAEEITGINLSKNVSNI